jgi:hypothetical protein
MESRKRRHRKASAHGESAVCCQYVTMCKRLTTMKFDGKNVYTFQSARLVDGDGNEVALPDTITFEPTIALDQEPFVVDITDFVFEMTFTINWNEYAARVWAQKMVNSLIALRGNAPADASADVAPAEPDDGVG